jgi:hypothetical protein
MIPGLWTNTPDTGTTASFDPWQNQYRITSQTINDTTTGSTSIYSYPISSNYAPTAPAIGWPSPAKGFRPSYDRSYDPRLEELRKLREEIAAMKTEKYHSEDFLSLPAAPIPHREVFRARNGYSDAPRRPGYRAVRRR